MLGSTSSPSADKAPRIPDLGMRYRESIITRSASGTSRPIRSRAEPRSIDCQIPGEGATSERLRPILRVDLDTVMDMTLSI